MRSVGAADSSFPLDGDTVRENLFGGRRRLYGTAILSFFGKIKGIGRLPAFGDEQVYILSI